MRLLPLVLCSVLMCSAVAQTATVRALRQELTSKSLYPRERGYKLERLSWYLCGADPMSAMEAAQEAIAIAERIDDKSLLGSAIVRRIAAKQTNGDRTGDAEELHKAIALLKAHGPERDIGYAYWCLFIELVDVAGQDSLRQAYNQLARTSFDLQNEATGRYWALSMDLYDQELQPRTADSIEHRIERIVQDAQDTTLLVDRYSVRINKALAIEDFEAAERSATEQLALSRSAELPYLEFIALSNLQAVATHSGDQEKAIRLGLEMLHLAQRLRSTANERWVHSEIAARFADLDDHASAMWHLRQALTIDGGPKLPRDRLEILLNLGRSCLKTGRIDTSLVVLHESERLLPQAAAGAFPLYESTLQGHVLKYLGMAYRSKGDLERSLLYLDEALQVAAAPNMRMDLARITIEHARSLALGGPAQRSAAIKEVQTVIDLAAREGWLETTRDARLALYEAYDRDGNASAALQNLHLYMVAKDSLIDLARIKNINALNKRFESEHKDAAIKDLSSLNMRQDAEIATQRRHILLLLAGGAAVVLISVLLFMLLHSIRRSRRLLAEKNAAILHAQAKLVESERAREASEVRTRIARDVHDQLGSDLTKLVLLSTEAGEAARSDVASMPLIADDIERIAGEANRSLGDIVWAIDPHHDSLAELTDRIRAHSERMLKGGKAAYTITCIHDGSDRMLDPATKRDIHLMFREALNNAVKYAQAAHIDIVFRSDPEQVCFEVKDDGVGMDAMEGKGHGLTNMRARAQRMNGQLDVDGRSGTGTRVSFGLRLSSV